MQLFGKHILNPMIYQIVYFSQLFLLQKNSSIIHEDLLSDTDRFSVVHNGDEFIKKYGSIIETPKYQFLIYISILLINNEFIFDIIQNNFSKK